MLMHLNARAAYLALHEPARRFHDDTSFHIVADNGCCGTITCTQDNGFGSGNSAAPTQITFDASGGQISFADLDGNELPINGVTVYMVGDAEQGALTAFVDALYGELHRHDQ